MSIESDFLEAWDLYPRKIGKKAAFREYIKARRTANAQEIVDGIERYNKHLPDDIQYVCHFRTFLHQGRWEDCYDTLPAKPEPQVGKLTAALQRASAGLARQHMRQVK